MLALRVKRYFSGTFKTADFELDAFVICSLENRDAWFYCSGHIAYTDLSKKDKWMLNYINCSQNSKVKRRKKGEIFSCAASFALR